MYSGKPKGQHSVFNDKLEVEQTKLTEELIQLQIQVPYKLFKKHQRQ